MQRPSRPPCHHGQSLNPVLAALRHTCLGLALAAPAILPALAHAQNPPQQSAKRVYDIPAGPLGAALSRFAGAAGVVLSFDAALTAGRESGGLHGSYDVDEGFARLLAGSGLEARAQGDGSYLLQPAPDAAAVLPAVAVSGKAIGAITEGTGLYTTYSSSSSTRLNLAPQETPQSLTVITRQQIEDLNATTLTALLDAVPGVHVVKEGVGDEIYGYYARGFEILNFEVDGVPTNNGLQLFSQNLAIYDRVEIVRGATGLISGMGNPAATINLIRKRPTLKPQASLSVEAGNWNRRGAAFDLSGALNDSGSVLGRLVGDAKRSGNWLDRYKEKSGTLYGIAEADLDDATLLTAGFSYQRADIDSPLRSGLPAFYADGGKTRLARSTNAAPSWSYNDQEAASAFVSVEQEWRNGWSGKAEYTYTEVDYDFVATYLSGTLQRDGSGLSLLPTRWKGKPTQHNLDLYLTGAFRLFGREHELIGGLTLSRYESSGPSYGGWQYGYAGSAAGAIDNLFTWDGNNAAPAFTASGSSSTKTRNNAAYLSSRLHLSDDLKLILGTRVVRWEQDERNWGNDGSASLESLRENIVVPYVGVVYALNKEWSAYASATKIFNPQGSWVKDENDSTLDPLEGTGYEIGVKGSHFGGRLQSSAALFHTKQDNLPVWTGVGLIYSAEQNTTSKGIELEVNGELAEGWQLAAGYAYTRTTDADGERLNTFLPRNSVKLHTSYRLPGALQGLTVGGGLRWQSKTGSYGVWQGSQTIASLMARYQIDRHLSVSLNVDNLFDRRYYSWPGSYSNYAAPRSAVLSMKYDF